MWRSPSGPFSNLAEPVGPSYGLVSASQILQDKTSCKVFVSPQGGKFPNSVSNNHLHEHFRQAFGRDFVSAFIQCNKRNVSRGFGTVKFTSTAVAQEAISKFKGTLLLDLYPLYIGFQKDPSVFPPVSTMSIPTKMDTPFQCPLEQTLYLKHLFFESLSLEGKSLMRALPADVLDKKEDYIYLSGNKDDIQSSCHMLERFLSVLKHHSLSFNYSVTFLDILQNHFITPIKHSKPSVTCLVQNSDFPVSMTVNIYSQESNDIASIYMELKALQPQSKTFCFRPEAEHVGNIQSILLSVSNHHRTISERRGRLSLVISGLSAHDIEETWRETKTEVDGLVIVTIIVPINAHQLNYLKAKHVSLLTKVKTECTLSLSQLPLPPGSAHEINVKGKLSPVNQAVQSMKLAISECRTEKTSVQCPVEHRPMWKTRWDTFVADKKRDGVLVEYAFELPSTTALITVTFTLYGGDIQTIQKARQVLLMEENGQLTQKHMLKLSEQHFRLYQLHYRDLQQSFKDTVYLESNVNGREAIIIAPSNSIVDLKKIEMEMKTFFSKFSSAVVTSTIHSSDRVVNFLLLEMKTECLKLKELNDSDSIKTKLIQKTGGKLIFQLEGETDKVRDARSFIKHSLSGICNRKVSTTRLSVPSRQIAILSSARFSSCVSMIEKELGVTCYYHSTNVVHKRDVQCSDGSVCTVQLCKGGSIAKENVDVVIVPTDRHFTTNAFREAEGLTQVTELEFNNACSEYLSENKAPSPGDAIEIDCGSLPFQNLILVVVDIYRPGSHAQAIQKAFRLACANRFGSLSITSLGTITFPGQSLTKVVLEAVDSVIQQSTCTSIHTVQVMISPTDNLDRASKDFEAYHMLKRSSALSSAQGSTTVGSSSISLPRETSASISSSDWLPLLGLHAHRGVVVANYKWQWQDDSGCFNDYSQELCDQLTSGWTRSPVGVMSVVIHKRNYSINFKEMTQTNVLTHVEREIKFVKQSNHNPSNSGAINYIPVPLADEANNRYKWLYENDLCSYSPYSTTDSSQIEQMFQGKLHVQQHLRIGRWTYMFNFQQMEQINIKTNRKRNIKREITTGTLPTHHEAFGGRSLLTCHEPFSGRYIKQEATTCALQSSTTLSRQVGNENEPNYIGFRGTDEKIKIAKRRIQSELQSLSISRLVSLPSNLALSSVFQCKLDNIIQQNKFVRIKVSSSATKKDVTLQGEEQKVLIALTEIQSEIIHFSDDTDQYPEEWTPQSTTCELFEVLTNSGEWTRISSQFTRSTSDNEILSIKQIQNQLLWEKYQNNKKLKMKSGGSVNEMQLFHGSRSTRPDDIARSEEGFDTRFSSSGMWGQANYFAVDASYSDTYAYQHPNNQAKEMFLVKVLTGDSITLSPDQSLRMPPEKQQTGRKPEATLKQVRYDSVNGRTHGSVVYMTYSNDRAYPTYVITYRRKSASVFHRTVAGIQNHFNYV